jgi:ankyrin repeat protein
MVPLLRSLVLFCAVAITAHAQNAVFDSTMFNAARDGDLATLTRMLSGGADANIADPDGWTPLMLAAMNGNVEAVRLLLAHSADPNFGEANQGPPLAVAAMTPFVPVGDENAILRLMIDKGAIVDIPNGAGMTPLMYAAREGNPKRIAFLLLRGADVNHRDARKWTPLRFASSSGNASIVRVLVSHGASPNVLDESYRTPLHHAVSSRNVDVVRALLDAAADPNLAPVAAGYPTALSLAAQQNDTTMIALLLERGALPNYSDAGDDGTRRTPLDWARVHRNKEAERALSKATAVSSVELTKIYKELLKAVRKGDDRTVAKLIAKRIDPRVPVRNGDDETFLLDEAVASGKPALVKALLPRRFTYDADALHRAYAAAARGGNPEITRMILENAPGKLAMMAIGESDGELLDAALAHADVIAHRDDDGRTLLHAAAASGSTELATTLLERGASVDALESWRETPLFEAARGESVEMIELLVRFKANVSARNLRGMTPLHAAARIGRSETVEALINAGADVDAADGNGWRPLHQAAWSNSDETVRVLLARGAHRDLLDKSRQSAFDIARQMKSRDAAQLLEQ